MQRGHTPPKIWICSKCSLQYFNITIVNKRTAAMTGSHTLLSASKCNHNDQWSVVITKILGWWWSRYRNMMRFIPGSSNGDILRTGGWVLLHTEASGFNDVRMRLDNQSLHLYLSGTIKVRPVYVLFFCKCTKLWKNSYHSYVTFNWTEH